MRANNVVTNSFGESHTEDRNPWAVTADRLEEAVYQCGVEAEVARALLATFEDEPPRGWSAAEFRRLRGALDAIQRVAEIVAEATGETEADE